MRTAAITRPSPGQGKGELSDIEFLALACRAEQNRAEERAYDEPVLPKGYRHVRSAIGVLLLTASGGLA